MEGSPYMGKPAKIWVPHSSDNARVASRASFRPYQITFQASFGLYQITFQTTYYIPPGDCRRRTARFIFFSISALYSSAYQVCGCRADTNLGLKIFIFNLFILKRTHPNCFFMSMSWIGKQLQLAYLETQSASLRC